MELPGIDEDDVEVAVDGDRLVVRGERRSRLPARPDRFHRMERSHGAFARAFALPQAVDPGPGAAQFRDGLLRHRADQGAGPRRPHAWRARRMSEGPTARARGRA